MCVGQAENGAMSVRVPEGDLYFFELATALLCLLLEGDGEVLVDLRSHHLWDLLYNLQADLLADRFTRRRAERTLTRRCGQTPKWCVPHIFSRLDTVKLYAARCRGVLLSTSRLTFTFIVFPWLTEPTWPSSTECQGSR